MAIQSNFPAIRPTLNLDFANSKTVDPRITFSRASAATYYDGKTTVKAEENLVTYSQLIGGTGWSGSLTSTTNNATAPDGSTTASVVAMQANTNTFLYNDAAKVVSGLTYTVSVYARSSGGTPFKFVTFNSLQDKSGTQTTTSTWTRYSWTFTSASAGTAGTGVLSDGSAGNIEFWGFQVENRPSVTAYTPTTTQPITNYIPVLQTAAAGVPRIDHDPITGECKGLLIEEQRTNLLTYSEQFDNAAWTKSNATITANAIVAPDGTLTADKLVESASTSYHFCGAVLASVTSGTAYTLTWYLKAGERTWARIETGGPGLSQNAVFVDLANGVFGTTTIGFFDSKTITSVGNGWYRVALTKTASSTSVGGGYVYPATSNTVSNYTGDGYSGIYIWGAQLEAGAFPTSYIKTEASQVTRSVDNAGMTGTNFSSWYRADEGTLFGEADTVMDVTNPNMRADTVCVSDGSINNAIFIGPNSVGGGNVLYVYSLANGVPQCGVSPVLAGAKTYKFAFASKANDFAVSLLGGAVVTDTSGSVSRVDRMDIGSRLGGGGNVQNGHIKRIAYYPKRLSNSELQALTA